MPHKVTASPLRGAEGFEAYYSKLFAERWGGLKNSLLEECEPRALRCAAGAPPYFLDAASVLAALSLPLEGAAFILDMCAAPGGKSLVLASLMESGAALKCNELSAERFSRLKRTVDERLPPEVRGRVRTARGDAALLCKKEAAIYDAILLDAPCSSERHVLADKKYLSEWSPARVKSLCARQWALLSSAFRLLKEGGFLLYSTCAINPSENGASIERLLKKFPAARAASEEEIRAVQERGKKKIAPFFDAALLPDFERSGPGFLVLPDARGGAGPIFFCLVQKAKGAV